MFTSRKALAFSLALTLAAAPLAACTGGKTPAAGGSSSSSTSAPAAAAVDISSWKTLADPLALASDSPDYGYDGKTINLLLTIGGVDYCVVADITSDVQEAFSSLDHDDPEYLKKFTEIFGAFPITEAKEISSDKLNEEQLAALVGKTGQELVDEGFVFTHYDMYGGEQTGAEFDKGYYCYSFQIDAHTSDSEAEAGALTQAVLEGKVTEIPQVVSFSNAAFGE